MNKCHTILWKCAYIKNKLLCMFTTLMQFKMEHFEGSEGIITYNDGVIPKRT